MNTKNFILQGVFLFAFSIFSTPLFSKQDKIYAPQDLTNPIFNKTDFVIDPDNAIDQHKQGLYDLRETYFFPTYVEPICVHVGNIKDPEDIEKYADKLVELWNLESRSAGRFVLQLFCTSKKTFVYRFGSLVNEFFNKQFIEDLTKTCEKTITNVKVDYTSLAQLGEQIYREVAYDAAITTYDNNTGIHDAYPYGIERAWGKPTPMKTSMFERDQAINGAYGDPYLNEVNGVKNYFGGLLQSEIDKNFSSINTNGKIIDIQAVINTRKKNGSHVTNQHNLLNDFGIGMIDQMLKDLEDSLGYQVAVVCLNSIGENDPHSWGTDLFNFWGIGQKETENGLLMLLIHDVHAIEFVTGRGTEGILTDVDCYNIQQNEMLPHFKQNDYVTGMIRGTQAVCDFFYGSPPLYTSGEYSDYVEEENVKRGSFFESGFFFWYCVIGGLLTFGWIVMLLISLFNSDLHKRFYLIKFFSLLILIFIYPIPFLGLYFITKALMIKWRNTERFSQKTGELMHKLDDNEEDKHLAKGQITEEKVKSIDYDVWITTGASDILILDYRKWFSKYNKCPQCKFKTYFKLYDKTISAATYDSSGTGQRCYKCENCGHTKTETYTIPRKTRSSSSSSGGGSGSSSSSSYGGGSSRGGGSGSRW